MALVRGSLISSITTSWASPSTIPVRAAPSAWRPTATASGFVGRVSSRSSSRRASCGDVTLLWLTRTADAAIDGSPPERRVVLRCVHDVEASVEAEDLDHASQGRRNAADGEPRAARTTVAAHWKPTG